MNTFRRILLFFFIDVGILFIPAIFFNKNVIEILINPVLWILPAFFTLLGWFIGVVIYEFRLRPVEKKNRIFLVAHCIGIVCYVTLIALVVYDQRQDNKNKYAKSNHNVMRYFVNDNEEYIRIAFNRLESEFKNPNDFKLDAFSVRKRDTIFANNTSDTLYTIYFAYYLVANKKDKYFSKVTVLTNTTTLHNFNERADSSPEYLRIDSEKRQNEREAFQSIKESFQEMPDSTRRMILDTIRKALKE